MLSEVKASNQKVAHLHKDCGGGYGTFGHMAIFATFECPECTKSFDEAMCAAWPVREKECPSCGFRANWTLVETPETGQLR